MATKAIAPWQRRKLAEVAEVRTGIAKNNEKALTDPVELPYLRVANVQDGHLDLTEIKTIAVESSRVERYSLEDGDVLMTEGGDFDKLGRGAVWRNQISPCLHQNHVFAVRVNRKHLLPEFLAAYCAAEPGRRYFLACSKQTTNPASINSSQLKALPLRLPSLDEQRCIVHALEWFRRQTSLDEELLEACESRYKTLLCTALKPVDQQRAKGWRRVHLGEIFAERDERSADLPLLAITGGHGVVPRDKLERRDTSAEDKSNYKVIRKGDIGYNTMRMWQGVFGLSAHDGIVSPAYTVVTPDRTRILGEFAAHLFSHPRIVHTFRRYSQGLVDDTLLLKYPHFSEIRLPIPNISEQHRIARALDTQLGELLQLSRLVELRRQQYRGLMQRLLTGKQRLAQDIPGMERTHD